MMPKYGHGHTLDMTVVAFAELQLWSYMSHCHTYYSSLNLIRLSE